MYKYAVVDDVGKCYGFYTTTNHMGDQYHVPISDIDIKYLDKYYYPIPKYIDFDSDFNGNWYLDFEHEVKVEEVPPEWLKN